MKRSEAVRDLTGTRAPRCVDGPWASPQAGRPLQPPLSCSDGMPAANILSSTSARQTSGYEDARGTTAAVIYGLETWSSQGAASLSNTLGFLAFKLECVGSYSIVCWMTKSEENCSH